MKASLRKHAGRPRGRPRVIEGGSAVVAAHVPLSHRTILQAEANEKRWPIAEVLREAIAQYVARKQARKQAPAV